MTVSNLTPTRKRRGIGKNEFWMKCFFGKIGISIGYSLVKTGVVLSASLYAPVELVLSGCLPWFYIL